MIKNRELSEYINQLLEVDGVKDYAPNGLQVEGRSSIKTLVTGVTASKALLEAALDKQADAILVHHGYFWKGEPVCITGMKQTRLRLLLSNQINLFAYHLPLDIHVDYGNNAQLAKQLSFKTLGQIEVEGLPLVFHGHLVTPMTAYELNSHIREVLGRPTLHIHGGTHIINTIAWCTGAGQSLFEHVLQRGIDAYITGEVSEQTTHIAREGGVHFYAAGHHATERYGVQALGKHLADKFGLTHHFVDIDNPV